MSEKCKIENPIYGCPTMPRGDYCPRHEMMVAQHGHDATVIIEYGDWCHRCASEFRTEELADCEFCRSPKICAECRDEALCCLDKLETESEAPCAS